MIKIAKSCICAAFYLLVYFILQFLFAMAVDNYKAAYLINTSSNSSNKFYYILNTPAVTAGAAIAAFTIFSLVFLVKKDNIYKFCRFRITAKSNIAVSVLFGVALSLLAVSIVKAEHIYNIKDFIKLITNNELNESVTFSTLISNTILTSLYSLIPAALILPVFEEILFRGLVLNELRAKLNIYLVLLMQAVLFGAMHLNLRQALITLLIGLILGILYIWYDSIWMPITIHIAYNLTGSVIAQVNTMYEKLKLLYVPAAYSTADVISTFVHNQSLGKQANLEQISKAPVYFVIASVSVCSAIIILCALYLWKHRSGKVLSEI